MKITKELMDKLIAKYENMSHNSNWLLDIETYIDKMNLSYLFETTAHKIGQKQNKDEKYAIIFPFIRKLYLNNHKLYSVEKLLSVFNENYYEFVKIANDVTDIDSKRYNDFLIKIDQQILEDIKTKELLLKIVQEN